MPAQQIRAFVRIPRGEQGGGQIAIRAGSKNGGSRQGNDKEYRDPHWIYYNDRAQPPHIVGSQELFERYLASPAPGDDPDSILETLLTDCAPPILNRVVRRRLGSLYTAADAAELASEAMLELLSRLRALAASGSSDLPFDA
ncbi:MAG: hypothetical protein WB421_17595, partial [Terriglobales bacterium]